MYWPDTKTGVDVEPARKPVASALRKYFSEGGVGQPPTVPGGDWFNQVTNELLNVLAAAGIDPSKGDDDQLLEAIQAIQSGGFTLDGALEAEPEWADVPAYEAGGPGGQMNAQAQALADRTELLLIQTSTIASYAAMRLYAGPATTATIGCRSVLGDGGEGYFYLDAADTTSADNDSTILVTTAGKRWKRVYSGSKKLTWFGFRDGINVTAALQKAVDVGGGELLIKDGQYTSNKVTIDHTTPYPFPSIGKPSRRVDLVGSSMPNTVFNVIGDFLEYIGFNSGSASQGIHSGSTFKEFSVVGTGKVGTGLRLKNIAFLRLSDTYFKALDIGLRLSGALTSDYNRNHFDSNNIGIKIDPDAYSNVNAVRFSGIFHSNTEAGVAGICGANVWIEDSNFEGNGTDGVAGTGGIILECNERMSTINISGYFEANVGEADILINNATASPLIVNLRGCTFTRGNSEGKGCLSNIDIRSSGGGQVILNLIGCYFFTQTAGGYVPDISRPYIKPYQHLIVNGEESCIFNESTSRADLGNSSSMLGLSMKADGTCTNQPLYLQPRRESVGVYFLDRLYTYSYDVDNLQIVAASRTSGVQLHYITKLTTSAIRLKFVDFAGAPADADFDVLITARK